MQEKKFTVVGQITWHSKKKKLSSYWMKIENSGTFGQYGGPVKGSNEMILY
jgi:hypothetical protein